MRRIGHTKEKPHVPIYGFILMSFILFTSIPAALAHGPKGHGNMTFTALEGVKKGVELYDRLVADGKLDESWETTLTDIKVFMRKKDQKEEFVVQFNRAEGDPRSVYIFFDAKGEYSGSNFTGE